ncbi:glycosyltransferase family 2 protein [Streptomyces sp. V4-01]|uniref:4,4'-diaponeurosporenoate glycosyltransferase n=1 Tax=Actinacidiphila polyblastidii TaxID=3110430 RepID=A0ABU7PG34_9ACTN|nr:glycosyltransferase family 2 protein [Streptomyces sp. V4-01]
MTSIVIPAHNEEQVIGRLLDALTAGAKPADGPGEFDIVVVCNGCTDATAREAARPGVTVVEIPVPSKHAALRAGDEHARGYPRLYVDADVVIDAAGVRVLADAVDPAAGVPAAAPGRDLPLAGCAWRVRAYYRVWQLLPAVREGLFGRGVIALSEAGHARIADLPPLMADDLAASLAFGPHERRVVEEARVTVLPPRTWADLIRRRVRADTSSHQLERHQAATPAESGAAAEPSAPPSARTSTADLRTLLLGRPWLLPHMAVFLAAAVIARRRSRRAVESGDFGTWQRDESSRTG